LPLAAAGSAAITEMTETFAHKRSLKPFMNNADVNSCPFLPVPITILQLIINFHFMRNIFNKT